MFRQYLATIVVGLLPLGHGLCCGWTSPNILILTSDDSPLPSGPITMKEASSVASILCLGGNLFPIFNLNKTITFQFYYINGYIFSKLCLGIFFLASSQANLVENGH